MAKTTKPAKSNDFIPEEATSGGSNSYLKLVTGDNKVRFLSAPIFGWLEWVDKKPIRTTLDDGEPEASDDENKPKKFMAAVVIDREDGKVKVMELTQQSVIKAIRALSANPDWGNPFTYDINIKKSGEGMKTKYEVTPSPKKVLDKALIKEAQATPVNLEALLEGENPFECEEGEGTEYQFK